MQEIDTIFYIIILVMSVVLHEVAHGYAAYRLGDQTARRAGRLTLNPLKHLDPFGSIILPFLLIITKAGFVIGWAKPVPYNPDNLSNRRWGGAFVAGAGVIVNFFIAFIFATLIRFSPELGLATLPFIQITSLIVIVNLALGVFNLVPIPPLDGSKILFSLLPNRLRSLERIFETYAFPILILFVLFFAGRLSPVIAFLFSLFTGVSI